MKVIGCENLNGNYAVTMEGKVVNIKTGRVMKTQISKEGYEVLTITLSKRRVGYFRIHRLVAEAFLGKSATPKNEVNHIDGNKLNNNYKNLEWCTKSENMVHAYNTGLASPAGWRRKQGNNPALEKRNKSIISDYSSGDFTHRKLAEKYDLSKTMIGNILLGLR